MYTKATKSGVIDDAAILEAVAVKKISFLSQS